MSAEDNDPGFDYRAAALELGGRNRTAESQDGGTIAQRRGARCYNPARRSNERTPPLNPGEPAKRTNRLTNETSPYLQQHATNPVDWYPWGPEALERSRVENKPILLSIGYSACHWCHVMAHESFEDEAIAALMNEHFVNVKVDREERPDIDEIYMNAVQILTGSGGWPLTVFLTPDRRPFYGGTYFPPDNRYGRPGFPSVLRSIADAYAKRADSVEESAEQLRASIVRMTELPPPADALDRRPIDRAIEHKRRAFDLSDGGFSGPPKFPDAAGVLLLLREHRRTGDASLLEMATFTLRKMAEGGMYDQLGGGFHRYSTDERWLVPHFEKMLYDNALLAQAYLAAFQLTGDAFFSRVVRETLDYVHREMTSPAGGFFSSQDADSEGEEGKFFVWSPDEIAAALGKDDAGVFCRFYDVDTGGNFEHGKSVLHASMTIASLARLLKSSEPAVEAVLARGRKKLFELRSHRVAPGRDDKVLTAWNGLMISAMAQAYVVLGDARDLAAAERAARFVLREMRDRGRLLRTHKDGKSHVVGYLEDDAFFAAALLDLVEATFDPTWLAEAQTLVDGMLERFGDDGGALFFTAKDGEALLTRTRMLFDNATPAGNSIAAMTLLRLATFTGERRYRERAEAILRAPGPYYDKAAAAFCWLLAALDYALDQPKEIAIAGEAAKPETQALLRAVRTPFTPNKVVALATPDLARLVPWLAGKTLVKGKPAAYVCIEGTCKSPITDPSSLGRMA
ncbi:MAG: thioredoxin domain-containing protein [Planctomycetes bacterium]|nr:thioredoxin domain-containing protein [Planctomycetota bacterium]